MRLLLHILPVIVSALVLSASQSHAQSEFRVEVQTSNTVLTVDQTVEVTATTYGDFNPNCPGYMPTIWLFLEVEPNVLQDENDPILEPARPGPAVKYPPSWMLQAVRPGIVTLRLDWSGELTGPNCGPPYYWGGGTRRFMDIAVFDPASLRQSYLPLLRY